MTSRARNGLAVLLWVGLAAGCGGNSSGESGKDSGPDAAQVPATGGGGAANSDSALASDGVTDGNLGTYDYVLRADSVEVDENTLILSLHGTFNLSSCDNAKLSMAGTPLTLLTCGADLVTAQAPPSGGGPVVLSIDGDDLDPVPLTDWSLTVSQVWSDTIPDLSSSQGTDTFNVRFRADVHEQSLQPGAPPTSPEPVPFILEKASSSMSWNASGTGLGQTSTTSGTTNALVPFGSAYPLPTGSFLWGEGYVSLAEGKLYLFLVGNGCEGESNCSGLMSGPTGGDCSTYSDTANHRPDSVFDLDAKFNIAGGSCTDPFVTGSSNGKPITSTRTSTWSFQTTYPPDPVPAP